MAILPAAIGIIFNDDQTKVLLIRRKDVPVWVLPGGGIETDETPEEAAIREIKEETGLDVKIVRKSAEYSPINKLSSLTHVFICKEIGGNLLPSSEEADHISFFHLHRYPNLFFDIHKEWIDDALNNHTLIKKPLKGVSYKLFLKYLFSHPILTTRYIFTRLFKK